MQRKAYHADSLLSLPSPPQTTPPTAKPAPHNARHRVPAALQHRHLHRKIPHRRALRRPAKNLQPRSLSRQPIQKLIPAPPAHHKQTLQTLPAMQTQSAPAPPHTAPPDYERSNSQTPEPHPGSHPAPSSPRAFRCALIRSSIRPASINSGSSTSSKPSGHSPSPPQPPAPPHPKPAPPPPSIHTLLDQPHPIHILVKADPSPTAARLVKFSSAPPRHSAAAPPASPPATTSPS